MPIALVADNDPGVRTLLADLVRRGGFEVRTAVDGSSARAQLEANGVDLLVCDLDMPGLSGQQLLAWMAGLPRPPQVLVVSGFVDAGIERDLLAHAFVRAVLRKPFDVFGFVQRLRELAKGFAEAVVPHPSPPVVPAAPTEGPVAGRAEAAPLSSEVAAAGDGGAASAGEAVAEAPPSVAAPDRVEPEADGASADGV